MPKLKKLVSLFLLLSLLTSACKPAGQLYTSQYFQFFDTVSEFTCFAVSESEFTAYETKVEESLCYYHRLFDAYQEYEGLINLATINKEASSKSLVLDKALFALIAYGLKVYDLSQGQLNIALGAVTKIWKDCTKEFLAQDKTASLPSEAELNFAAQHTDIKKIHLDAENHSISISDPDLRIDLGALAKGYAADLVKEELLALGCQDFLLNLGGDLLASGFRDGTEEKWRVAIDNPLYPAQATNPYAKTLELSELSLVSSAGDKRYFIVDEERYHHLIDPKTLRPANYFSLVAVMAPEAKEAEFLSTSLFTLELEAGQKFLAQFPQAKALWILPEGEIIHSANFS